MIDPSTTPLFHVAAPAIPIGQILRPYAVVHQHVGLVQRAVQALEVGPVAIGRLLAEEAWVRLAERGYFRTEMVLLEAIFEHARTRTDPALPNRLDAVFAWNDLELSMRFKTEYRPDGVIHRCQLVDGTWIVHDGALVVAAFESANLTTPNADDLRRTTDLAVQYWRAEPPFALSEVVVHGTVVIEAVESEEQP